MKVAKCTKLGLQITTIFCFLGLSQSVMAAGPVAVSKGKSAEVITTTSVDTPIQFSIGIGAGYLTGESTELVYWPTVNNHKASELTWKIDSLYMIGVNGKLTVNDWFKANFSGWFKATDGDGTMDDYDWQNPGQEWTDWSHHEDTDVTDGSIIDLNGEIIFFRASKVSFSGILGYKYDNFGWESRGGDYTYSVSGFRDTQGSFTDGALAISYEQTFSSFYGGVGVEVEIESFTLKGRVIYSPFVYGEATDYHHMRNLVTYDTFDSFEDGDLIGIDISGIYEFTKKFALEIGFSYQSYSTLVGDSEWQFRDEGVVYEIKDGAGMDQTSSMFTTNLVYTF